MDLLAGRTPILAKWIFKTKLGTTDKPEKLKARIVARGFEQEDGLDYFKTFAPVVR